MGVQVRKQTKNLQINNGIVEKCIAVRRKYRREGHYKEADTRNQEEGR